MGKERETGNFGGGGQKNGGACLDVPEGGGWPALLKRFWKTEIVKVPFLPNLVKRFWKTEIPKSASRERYHGRLSRDRRAQRLPSDPGTAF
jgi:hypothetical protein